MSHDLSSAAQRYTCPHLRRSYRYEGLSTGFAAHLDVDGHGLLMDYPGVFRRL